MLWSICLLDTPGTRTSSPWTRWPFLGCGLRTEPGPAAGGPPERWFIALRSVFWTWCGTLTTTSPTSSTCVTSNRRTLPSGTTWRWVVVCVLKAVKWAALKPTENILNRRTTKQEAGREEIKGTFVFEAIRGSSDGNQRVDTVKLREVFLEETFSDWSQRCERAADGEGHRVSAAGGSNITQLNTHTNHVWASAPCRKAVNISSSQRHLRSFFILPTNSEKCWEQRHWLNNLNNSTKENFVLTEWCWESTTEICGCFLRVIRWIGLCSRLSQTVINSAPCQVSAGLWPTITTESKLFYLLHSRRTIGGKWAVRKTNPGPNVVFVAPRTWGSLFLLVVFAGLVFLLKCRHRTDLTCHCLNANAVKRCILNKNHHENKGLFAAVLIFISCAL